MAEPAALSMVRIRLDSSRLAREHVTARLPPQQDDLGTLAHALLAALFGEGTVQPFRVLDENARWVAILGYTTNSEAAMREHASAFADPGRYVACDWQSFAVKPMPDTWEGRRLRFELRVCPVVRLGSETELLDRTGELRRYPPGAEVDAWVHRRWMAREADPTVSREQAYAEWLRARLEGAAELGSMRLTGFRRRRLVRRDHASPRRAKVLERPEALLGGDLEVRDGEVFRGILARGVGRHRAFGFGMLLLRPPG